MYKQKHSEQGAVTDSLYHFASSADLSTRISARSVSSSLTGASPWPLSSISNLANSFHDRFGQQGPLSDLDEAIELYRAALALRPPGHSDRSTCLDNLAISLRARFEQQGALSDLDEAIELHRAALTPYPPGHSLRSSSLDNLAIALQVRFERQSVSSDLGEAFRLYLQLSQVSHAVTRGDLRAANSWATSAEQLKHHSSMVAYQTALKFLDSHVAILSSFSRHFDVVREATLSIAMDAFSYSIRHDALTTAVELYWTQLARFRTSPDELSASGDTSKALAQEFKQLSSRLRKVLGELDVSPEEQSSHIRKLTVKWHGIISRICMVPSFFRFLLPPLFSDLQKAAEDGPVIIVNASQYSCDALIILRALDPVHISLDIARAEVSE
ncbi:hypothetical protein DFH29DRAFT_1069644 [Suillus ampliporus]|nr:hypothetical protein DFH29DRAFT_1069644 [Suillus ampliporus]